MVFSAVSQVVVQGIFSDLGRDAVSRMMHYGTHVVAGIEPGAVGQSLADCPIVNSVADACAEFGDITVSVICTAPYQVLDAAREAIQIGVRQLVILTVGVPPLDMIRLLQVAERHGVLVVGATSPGVILPGQVLLGNHPVQFYAPGRVAILSRSDTLTYDVARHLTAAGIGQSIAVGIGSDPIVGSTLSHWLQMLEADAQTDAIVLVGQVGGDAEELAAQTIMRSVTKPVVAYLVGEKVPRPRCLGHASTILEVHSLDVGPVLGTFASKTKALSRAGVPVAASPVALPGLLAEIMPVVELPETA